MDSHLVFGAAKVVLGVSKTMEYIVIAILVIGAALILIALTLFGFTTGFGKLGGAIKRLKRGQSQA